MLPSEPPVTAADGEFEVVLIDNSYYGRIRMTPPRMYSVEETIKAQRSLRKAAGLGPEQFPVEALVGMISDEI